MSAITPEIAEALLAADDRNLVEKIKSGAALNRSERNRIEAIHKTLETKKAEQAAKAKAGTTHDSMSGASSILGIDFAVMRWAKASGCPAFKNGRIIEDVLIEWLESNPPPETIEQADVADVNKKLKSEQARYWQLRNQRATALLVERAWVIDCFNKASGELNTLRAKSEAEHPLLFATACPGADVAACRTILRGIWSEVFKAIGQIGRHFDEAPGSNAKRLGLKPKETKKAKKK